MRTKLKEAAYNIEVIGTYTIVAVAVILIIWNWIF